ncbi:protein of unknown function [Cardinium endosymbiont cEper1 of Encarsia pergandiella]|nr:protein of unknown function [Cardinium endosymbiont cEper1 of Encarsia pergandiella]
MLNLWLHLTKFVVDTAYSLNLYGTCQLNKTKESDAQSHVCR